MPSSRPELRRGRVIWASIRDHRGIPKDRPLIVLTPTDELPDEVFEVVVVTTTFADPPPEDHIPLPCQPQGRVGTQLRRRSAAVLTWIGEVHPDDVIRLYGDVPVHLMTQILQRIGRPS